VILKYHPIHNCHLENQFENINFWVGLV